MQAPVCDKAAEDVNYSCQIHKALLHRYIGDVNTPDLILMIDLKAPELNCDIIIVFHQGTESIYRYLQGHPNTCTTKDSTVLSLF
jgi:hypothetical protein